MSVGVFIYIQIHHINFSKKMVFNQLTLFIFLILYLTIYAAQLEHPFKQCSCMYTG